MGCKKGDGQALQGDWEELKFAGKARKGDEEVLKGDGEALKGDRNIKNALKEYWIRV